MTRRRSSNTSQYQARVGRTGSITETVQIDEDGDREAVLVAFGAISPYGHSLWSGRRFLGYFDPGDLRVEQDLAVHAALMRGPAC